MTGDKRAYSYIRFSRPEQARGDSLRRQTQDSEKWAREHGFVLDESMRMIDRGISGYTGLNRTKGALGEFLKRVENGEVERGSILIVESLDRLSREAVPDALTSFMNLLREGIEIVTLLDNQRYSWESIGQNPSQLFGSIVVMSRANEESARKADRIASSWEAKRKAAATGRAATKQCPAWLRINNDGRYEVIPERGEIVRWMFEQSIKGLGQRLIAQQLNETGVEPWGRSDGWQTSYISKILNSRATLGEFTHHRKIDGKRVPITSDDDAKHSLGSYYPPVVSEDEFNAAAAARRKRDLIKTGEKKGGTTRGTGRHGKGFPNLLRGLAVCGQCGGTMIYQSKGRSPKSGAAVLTCSRKARGIGCTAGGWKYHIAESALLHNVRRLPPETIRSLVDQNTVDERRALERKLDAAQEKLVKLRDQRKFWADEFENSRDPEAGERMRARTNEIKITSTIVQELKNELISVAETFNPTEYRTLVGNLIRKMNESAENFSIRLQLNSEIRKIVDRIECYDDDLLIFYKKQGGRRSALPDERLGFSLLNPAQLAVVIPTAEEIAELDAMIEHDEWARKQKTTRRPKNNFRPVPQMAQKKRP